jgi:SAM-dependent methyltransferase
VKSYVFNDPLFAQLYDCTIELLIEPELKELEFNFWKSCARHFGDPILEMGCSTGRLLIPLAKMGYSVTGIDISFNMLRIFRQNLINDLTKIGQKVQCIAGDMTNPPVIGCNFCLIIFAGSLFLQLENDEKRLDCLKNCSHLLAEDGVIVISNFKLEDSLQSDKRILGECGGNWIVETWENVVFQRYFKLIPKFKKQQEHLYRWSLYPIETTYMKQLIEKAELQSVPLPPNMPVPEGREIYLCKKFLDYEL